MRNNLIFIFLFALFQINLFSQVPNYQIKFNAVSPFLSGIGFGYEFPVSSKINFIVYGDVYSHKFNIWDGIGASLNSYKIGIEGKMSMSLNRELSPFNSFYSSIYINRLKSDVKSKLPEGNFSILNSERYNIGILFGRQFGIFKKNNMFPIEVAIGGGYSIGNVKGRFAQSGKQIIYSRNGFQPKISIYFNINSILFSKSISTDSGFNKFEIYHNKYTNKEKKIFEKKLFKLGYLKQKPNKHFDNETMNAIILFQKANKLSPDGLIGDATNKAFNLKEDK